MAQGWQGLTWRSFVYMPGTPHRDAQHRSRLFAIQEQIRLLEQPVEIGADVRLVTGRAT
jgi:hypothetical protein